MTLQQYKNHNFESSSGLTPEFVDFAKKFRKHIKDVCGQNFDLVAFNRGHFYLSGFVQNKTTNKHAYFSLSDVRWVGCGGSWWDSVLVRTADNPKDYTGGANTFASVDNLGDSFARLTA